MMVSRSIAEYVTNFVSVSELLQMNAWPAKINILQVYAPTTDHSEEEVEEFYAQITALVRKLPKQDLTIDERLQREDGQETQERTHRIMGSGRKEWAGVVAECVCGKT